MRPGNFPAMPGGRGVPTCEDLNSVISLSGAEFLCISESDDGDRFANIPKELVSGSAVTQSLTLSELRSCLSW